MKTKIGIGIAVVVLLGAIFFGNKELFRGFFPSFTPVSTPTISIVANAATGPRTYVAGGAPQVLLGSWVIATREAVTLQDFIAGPATPLRGINHLRNISLRIDGNPVGTTLVNLSPRENRFSGSVDMKAGSTVIAEVFGDVAASYTPLPETFALKAGILGVSRVTGKSVKSNSTSKAQNITVAGPGQLILLRDPAGPVANTLTPGEHVLGSWILQATPVEDLRVTKVCFNINGTIPAEGISLVKLKISSGTTVLAVAPMRRDFTAECVPYPLSSQFTVRAGEGKRVSLVANITPAAPAGSTIGSRIGNIEYIGLSSLTTNNLSMLVNGPTHTIAR